MVEVLFKLKSFQGPGVQKEQLKISYMPLHKIAENHHLKYHAWDESELHLKNHLSPHPFQ